ncbi:MAG: sulfatase-like hydrolase/transferase [Planctomycetales bacterium]|nr:sulfatase-like hydrolase/transferase [Planctomycetales bacterium]
MNRIYRMLLCVFCTLAVHASTVVAQSDQAKAAKTQAVPNVVLIYIDDLGYGDLGSYHCTDIPTPNIDGLASQGVRFTASYITNPPCCPSRCSLMMGQYGQRFGKYGMSRGLPIPEDRPTLAGFLRDNGYVTGQIGKWDIGTKLQGPLQVGFSEVAMTPPKKKYANEEIAGLPESLQKQLAKSGNQSKYFCVNESGDTMWLTDYDGDSMVDFIQRHKAEPFFLYWSPEAVHSPSTEVPERLMSRTQAEGKRRKLAGAIVSIDDQVGKLIATLKETGLRKNTLVIFSSDNGANGDEGGSSTPYVGGKGQGTQKEGWVRVPTIFSMPGTLPQGKQFDGLIANFDFYATIAALAGKPIPEHCDGVDLFPYLTDSRDGDPHEYLFWLNNEPGDAVRRHVIAVRWKDWRLYKKYEKDAWQLFDLKSDPQEEHDVAAAHPDIVNDMAARHAAWVKTLAPLGKIPQVRSGKPAVPTGHGWAFAADTEH